MGKKTSKDNQSKTTGLRANLHHDDLNTHT